MSIGVSPVVTTKNLAEERLQVQLSIWYIPSRSGTLYLLVTRGRGDGSEERHPGSRAGRLNGTGSAGRGRLHDHPGGGEISEPKPIRYLQSDERRRAGLPEGW